MNKIGLLIVLVFGFAARAFQPALAGELVNEQIQDYFKDNECKVSYSVDEKSISRPSNLKRKNMVHAFIFINRKIGTICDDQGKVKKNIRHVKLVCGSDKNACNENDAITSGKIKGDTLTLTAKYVDCDCANSSTAVDLVMAKVLK